MSRATGMAEYSETDTLRKEGVDLMVAGKLAAQCMTYMKKGEMINNTKKSRRLTETSSQQLQSTESTFGGICEKADTLTLCPPPQTFNVEEKAP